MNAFFAALQFLTVFPRPPRAERTANELGRAAVFFPVIGLLLGSILVLTHFLISPFASPALASVILVTLLALLTRGLHLDGLGDTFDGLGAGGEPARRLRAMDDSSIGAFGAIAVVLALFLKIHALESMDTERWRSLLAAPLLGRWSMVLLGYRSKPAKPGLGSTFIEQLSTRHLAAATLITLLSTAVLLRAGGLVMILYVAAFTLACKIFFHRRLGGISGDIFGAVGELSETSVMVLLTLGAR